MDFPALNLDDPQTQAWLGMSAALLQAGGASPYPVGIGEALGRGIQGGLQGYKSGQENLMQQQKLRQMKQQNDLNEQFAPMMNNPQGFSPDALEAMGMKLALGGHPGAATLAKIADARRAQEKAQRDFAGMRSGEGYGGLFGNLTESPHVGDEAKALQEQLDKSEAGNPEQWMRHYERLRTAHFQGVQADKKGEEAPVAVMGPNGPVYVSRKDAIGKVPANSAGSTNAVAPGSQNLHGDDYLKTLQPGMQALVKKVANYDIDPKTFSTRGGQREQILAHVAQYDPSFDQKTYNTQFNAINRFATGPQGNTTRSLNVAIEHMDTARRLGAALQNGNTPAINALATEFAKQTGKPAPTNFDAVKEIVADEVVKGVIGGAGALEDRRAAAEKIRRAASPQQLNGVLDSWTELLGGQLKGLERQYEGATGRKDFKDRYLTPRAREATSPQGGGGGWTDDKERRYQELLRKRGS